jgi:hypothetical protein
MIENTHNSILVEYVLGAENNRVGRKVGLQGIGIPLEPDLVELQAAHRAWRIVGTLLGPMLQTMDRGMLTLGLSLLFPGAQIWRVI